MYFRSLQNYWSLDRHFWNIRKNVTVNSSKRSQEEFPAMSHTGRSIMLWTITTPCQSQLQYMRHDESAVWEQWTHSVAYNLIITPVTLYVNECFYSCLLQRRLFGWKHKEFSHNINQTVKERAAYLISQTEQWFKIGVLRKRSVRKTQLLKTRGHCLNTLTLSKFSVSIRTTYRHSYVHLLRFSMTE